MAERDKYDKDILKALQKIGKHLESIDKELTTGIVIPTVEEKKRNRGNNEVTVKPQYE